MTFEIQNFKSAECVDTQKSNEYILDECYKGYFFCTTLCISRKRARAKKTPRLLKWDAMFAGHKWSNRLFISISATTEMEKNILSWESLKKPIALFLPPCLVVFETWKKLFWIKKDYIIFTTKLPAI